MKKLYKYFLVCVFGVIGFFPVFSHQELEAHIYMDFASTPALAQLVDALSQPKGAPKLFLWTRMRRNDNSDLALLQINAQMHLDGLGEWDKYIYSQKAVSLIDTFIKNYPEHLFHVHFNERHYQEFFQDIIKKSIPNYKVKKYHIYEDSAGFYIWDTQSVSRIKSIKEEFCVDKIVLYGRDNERLKRVFDLDQVVEIDFVKMASTLNEFQKEIISDLFGIDRYEYQSLFKNKTVAFFDENDVSFETMKGYIDRVIKLNPDLKNYIWIYKNHPRREAWDNRLNLFDDYISKENVISLSNKMTYEALVLLGFQPDYMMGYSSSLFFTVGQSQILGYIPRRPDYYLPLLLEDKIVKPSDVLK